MSNSQTVSLFGGQSTATGQRVSGGVARQVKRETEQVAGATEIASVREQAHAFLTSQVMSNAATLVMQAEALMRIAPAGAQFYESAITGYAIGAARRLDRSL